MKARDKRFLSDSVEEFGSVSWSVVTGDEPDTFSKVEAGIRMTDCYTPINLGFNSDTKAHFDKRLKKIRNLIESLEEFEDNLKQAGKVYSVKRPY